MGKAMQRKASKRKKEGRKEEHRTEKVEKVEWEKELSFTVDKILFYSTLIASLYICYRFNVAFVLSLSIKCAKSLCKKSWTTNEPQFWFWYSY